MVGAQDFRLLLAARTVSMAGTRIATVAIPFAVLELTGSATDVGLVLAAAWVPQILLLLVGGVVADRMPRQRVMVVADATAGLMQAASAALLLTGTLSIPVLAVLQAINGAATAFFFPASMALVPETVRGDELRAANATLRTFMNAASIAGAAVGGALAALSVGGALAVDAVSFGASAICCVRIGVAGAVRGDRTSAMADLRAGWAEFARTRWLWAVVVQFGVVNACFDAVIFVLGPVLADRHLGGAAAWGAVLASFSAGLLLGALVSFRIRPRRPLLVGELAVLPFALPPLLLIGPSPVVLIAIATLAAGFGCEIFGVQWSLAMQQHVAPESLARMSSFDALGSFALVPVALAAAGPLSESIGMRSTLIGAFAVIAAATVWSLLVRDVRELPATDHPAAAAAPPA